MATKDITILKGVTFTYPILIWIDNRTSRKNLTGFTANLKIRKKLSNGQFDTTNITELTTANGGIVLGGTNGTVDLFISASNTALLPTTNAFYDLRLINGSIVENLLSGQVNITDTVTPC